MSRDRPSALVLPHRGERRGCVDAEVARCLVDDVAVLRRPRHPASGEQVLPVVTSHRHKQGHRTTAISDFERLAAGHAGKVAAGVLAQLPYSDALHVLQGSTMVATDDVVR